MQSTDSEMQSALTALGDRFTVMEIRLAKIETNQETRMEQERTIRNYLLGISLALIINIGGWIWFLATDHAEQMAMGARIIVISQRVDELWIDYRVRAASAAKPAAPAQP